MNLNLIKNALSRWVYHHWALSGRQTLINSAGHIARMDVAICHYWKQNRNPAPSRNLRKPLKTVEGATRQRLLGLVARRGFAARGVREDPRGQQVGAAGSAYVSYIPLVFLCSSLLL